MKTKRFYIEPSALSYSLDKKCHYDEQDVAEFLYHFEKMLFVLQDNGCKFVIDSYLNGRLIDGFGKVLIPLSTKNIINPELKERVNRIKQSLPNIIYPLIELVDTDPCSIEENKLNILPKENSKLMEVDYYCDFFHSILGECYRMKNIEIDSVLTIPFSSKLVFEENSIILACKCSNDDISKKISQIEYTELINEIEESKSALIDRLKMTECVHKNKVEVVQAVHHAVIGNTILTCFDNIPSVYKKVLEILLSFGMFRVDFRELDSHAGIKGNIYKCILQEGNSDRVDIVEGWMKVDDMSCKVVMYFPESIGRLLLKITGNEFKYKEMIDLNNELSK